MFYWFLNRTCGKKLSRVHVCMQNLSVLKGLLPLSRNIWISRKIPKGACLVTRMDTEVSCMNGSNNSRRKDGSGHSMFPLADTFYVHTGNISHWSSLKRKTTQSPATELHDSLVKTLSAWMKEVNSNEADFKEKRTVCCVNAESTEKVPEEERPLMKVTAKIFAHKINPSQVKEAVLETLRELGTSYLDVAFIAFPQIEEGSSISFTDFAKPYWREMERLMDSKIALQIATCDLDRPKLEELFSFARVRDKFDNLKPEVNQVNLTSCCHMPEELVAFAKENDILLHTHGDPPVLLTGEALEDVIQSVSPMDAEGWTANWVVRYAVIVKCRGVIKNKGYIVSCSRSGISSPRIDAEM